MAHLGGQMEDEVLALHQVVHSVPIPDVGDIELHPVADRGDVEEVPAVGRDHGVDQGHTRAEFDEPDGKRAADEAEPSGDENLRAVEAGHLHGDHCGLERDLSGAVRLLSSVG